MRRLLVVFAIALVATSVVVGSVSADSKRNARSGVSVYQLADAAGNGDVHGLGVIVQRGRTIRWWVSGSGLTPGFHAQHIHGPGTCEANAPIILPFPDIEVRADGTFSASGRLTTKLKIAAGGASKYWNIHSLSTAGGVGAGVTCGERIKVSISGDHGHQGNDDN